MGAAGLLGGGRQLPLRNPASAGKKTPPQKTSAHLPVKDKQTKLLVILISEGEWWKLWRATFLSHSKEADVFNVIFYLKILEIWI